MRRLLLSLAAISLLISCSSDNDEQDSELILSSTEETINIDATTKITASEECRWISNNEFIAEVDESGNIKANHVGETTIRAISSKKPTNYTECKIVVKGTLNTYKEPVLEFGISMSELLEKESRTFSRQYSSDGMAFNGDNSAVDRINYYFENDKLIQVDVVILHNYSDAVKNTVDEYLLERYAKSSKLDAQHTDMVWNNAYFMVNGNDDDYDVVVYHYPFAACFGSTTIKWGNYRWTIIYTYKGRTPTIMTENW